ncbi:MAG TPA: hypothetical protein VEI04_09325 [Syntrophobacteria bacterium]|nr:hypothetical protein [Syntrophobacteria bacterium]
MERITIHSGLERFVLVDGITETDPGTIKGYKHFDRAPIFLGIEALAQLGALHVRVTAAFARHAFLLGIKRCTVSSGELLDGRYTLLGAVIGRTTTAFSYLLEASKEGRVGIDGEFLFATVEYDGVFRKEVLESHYRKVFLCLSNASESGSRCNGKPASTASPRR